MTSSQDVFPTSRFAFGAAASPACAGAERARPSSRDQRGFENMRVTAPLTPAPRLHSIGNAKGPGLRERAQPALHRKGPRRLLASRVRAEDVDGLRDPVVAVHHPGGAHGRALLEIVQL